MPFLARTVFSGYLIYVRQQNVDDCSYESENAFREINFPFYNGAFVLFSFPLRVHGEQANQDVGNALCRASIARYIFALIVASSSRCGGILRERRLMLELLGLLGQGSLKEKTPFFMLFSCLFIWFSCCFFYFEPFFRLLH